MILPYNVWRNIEANALKPDDPTHLGHWQKQRNVLNLQLIGFALEESTVGDRHGYELMVDAPMPDPQDPNIEFLDAAWTQIVADLAG